MMTAKTYLSQVKILTARLRSMGQQVKALNDSLLNVSPMISDMPKALSPVVDRMAELVAVKVDLERDMEADSCRLAEIMRSVNSLQNVNHVEVLTCRYFARMEWREIAFELHVSESRIYQLHRDALAEVEKSIVGCS